jgi:hypothetical protein
MMPSYEDRPIEAGVGCLVLLVVVLLVAVGIAWLVWR